MRLHIWSNVTDIRVSS